MRSGLHHHFMANNCRGVDIHIVFHHCAAYAGYMRVNAVPAAYFGIMSYYRVRLYHVIVADNSIISDDRIGPNEVSLAQLRVCKDTRRLVDKFHELSATVDNS